ncbi:MAG TPA: AAA family ATPase [Thermoleophilaceae bacterium]|nr:AAA family ATPase [Thermoleophilaceae bacterium]
MTAPAPEEALRSPALYPHRPDVVKVVETHISWVFLAADRAYKLRKPVVFPFLDYGTLERRRHMCEEEVRLGRRLAPNVYVGVRPLLKGDTGWTLGEAGAKGSEYVVEMRRFDERLTLAALQRAGAVDAATMRAVAARVAAFHEAATPASPGSFDPEAVAATVSENFSTLIPYELVLGQATLAGAHRFAVAFLHAHSGLIERRTEQGFVRDCHGDLRAEHVLVENDGVAVFDPVEFDPSLREIDVSAELAFLVMDLMDVGAEDLADTLIREYEAAGGDPGGRPLLYFYAAYRALVRAKVACLRAGELPPHQARSQSLAEARRLVELARRLAWCARRPLVLVFCGASATGKTYLAGAVSALSGLPHLSSDLVRKELAGVDPTQRAPLTSYTDDESRDTYRELGARTARAASVGAVVDATFRRRSHREAFTAAFPGNALFVECRAPASVVAERAARRESDPDRVSDATPAIAAGQLADFEPLDEVLADSHLLLRTDRPLETLLDDLEAGLDARLAPVQPPVRRRTESSGGR